MPQKKISIVIPNHNSLKTLRACVESIFAVTTYKNWELIIVDDGSTDGSLDYLETLQQVKVIRQPHQGIASALNAGFEAAGKNDVVRIHSDVVIETPDWLEKLAEAASSLPKAGVIGSKLVYPDDRIYSLGRNLLTGVGMHERFVNRNAYDMDSAKFSGTREVDSVCGALAYYTRKAISKNNGIDENYYPAWTEDDDFCVATRVNGYKVYIHQDVKAVHYTRSWSPTSQIYFQNYEGIVNTINSQKQPVCNYHYSHWEKKWGWNPLLPDLNEIRRIYGKTELCWQIGAPMQYQTPESLPAVDACFVTWNNLHILKPCLESLAATDYPPELMRVFIADNSSTDGTLEYLEKIQKKFPFEMYVEKLPVNTGAIIGWNIAISRGSSELVARLDDDIILPPDWLKKMVADFSKRPYAGVIGTKIVNNDIDRFIQCGSYRFYPRKYNHWEEPDGGQANYLARSTHVMGCCNLYRRDALQRCGLFDLRFSPTQWDDPDHHISLLVEGYEVIYDGSVEVRHKVPSTVVGSRAAISNQIANKQKLEGKWGQNIYEILDFSLDLSREGRFLPEDGDTSKFLALGISAKEFPRPDSLPLNESIKAGLMKNFELIGKGLNAVDLTDFINDYTIQSYTLRRDGQARISLDVLHTALSLEPWSKQVMLDLAKTYHLLKQYKESSSLLERVLRLEPEESELQEYLDVVRKEADSYRNGRPTSRMDSHQPAALLGNIGESDPGSVPETKSKKKPRLKVMMVNAYENRVPGGDMHQIKKTRQHLEKLGVQVDIDTNPNPDTKGYDLVHLWNMWFPHQTISQVKAIKVANPNIPIIHSTIYWDMSEKTWAELTIPQLFRKSTNAQQLDGYLRQMANDEVKMNGMKRSTHIEPYPGYEIYQKQILQHVDHLLPQSYAEIRNMVKTLGIRKPYHVIRNAAESEIFDRATKDWFVKEYGVDQFVLMIGLVEVRKNQLMVLQAMKDMGIPVVIIGRNYDRSYMQLCEKYAPANTIFIEHIPHELLASALKAARVFVLPSWMECASLAIVEAALAGCSLVVSNRTSEPEYYQDHVYYCDPANVDSIRQAIKDAYWNYESDAPKREKLRQLFLTDYTWEKAAQDTLEAYEYVISNAKAKNSGKQKSEKKTAYSAIIHGTAADKSEKCLLNLRNLAADMEIILVDDGASIPDSIEADKIIRHRNPMGEARSYNEGLVRASADLVLLISDHVNLDASCLDALTKALDDHPNVVMANPVLVDNSGYIRQAGIHRLTPIETHAGKLPQDLQIMHNINLMAATGEVILARKSALSEENWLDESLIDETAWIDLSMRLRNRGLDILFVQNAKAYWDGNTTYNLSSYALSRFNQIWTGNRLLPMKTDFSQPIKRSHVQKSSFETPIKPESTPAFTSQTRELYNRLLNSADIKQALSENAALLDEQLLALVQYEEKLSRRTGDAALADGLVNLAQYIKSNLTIPSVKTGKLNYDANETLQLLLEADDIVQALKENEYRFDSNLLKLVQTNARSAQNDGNSELADGLLDLAQYIEKKVTDQQDRPVKNDAASTLDMILNSNDIMETLQNNRDRIDQDLLTLINLNAANAFSDGDIELSEGLNNLARIISQMLP